MFNTFVQHLMIVIGTCCSSRKTLCERVINKWKALSLIFINMLAYCVRELIHYFIFKLVFVTKFISSLTFIPESFGGE